jgi:hypothetical protein
MFKIISNRFPGTCHECGERVNAQAGYAVLAERGGKWSTVCGPCHTGEAAPAAPAAPSFPLTDEQEQAVALFAQGHSLAIQAGAGTGKTSTLVAIANSTGRSGQYVAFNRAIVDEAARKFPRNVACATAHSLAFRQVGFRYKNRLNSQRQSGAEVAARLRLSEFTCTVGGDERTLSPAFLASLVGKAITAFCNSADEAPTTRHLPTVRGLCPVDETGATDWTNQNDLARHLAPALETAWADIIDPKGAGRFTHDCYLKIWELGLHGAPSIPGDFILFDEAQDASPVLLSVVQQQGVQVVFVGDAQQAIYEWRGAVDALATVPADATSFLTNSFRFGPEVAEVANAILSTIPGAELRLVGRGAAGTVGPADEVDAVLTRTNSGAISVVLDSIASGLRPHLVGGGTEVKAFAEAARDLQQGRSTSHPELAIFASWDDVVRFVNSDPQGEELACLVRLIENYGVGAILSAVSSTVSESDADLVVSTAHKSKGREWDRVRIHGDFAETDDSSELRLLYVAVTRARLHLDGTGCAPLAPFFDQDGEEG